MADRPDYEDESSELTEATMRMFQAQLAASCACCGHNGFGPLKVHRDRDGGRVLLCADCESAIVAIFLMTASPTEQKIRFAAARMILDR